MSNAYDEAVAHIESSLNTLSNALSNIEGKLKSIEAVLEPLSSIYARLQRMSYHRLVLPNDRPRHYHTATDVDGKKVKVSYYG